MREHFPSGAVCPQATGPSIRHLKRSCSIQRTRGRWAELRSVRRLYCSMQLMPAPKVFRLRASARLGHGALHASGCDCVISGRGPRWVWQSRFRKPEVCWDWTRRQRRIRPLKMSQQSWMSLLMSHLSMRPELKGQPWEHFSPGWMQWRKRSGVFLFRPSTSIPMLSKS